MNAAGERFDHWFQRTDLPVNTDRRRRAFGRAWRPGAFVCNTASDMHPRHEDSQWIR